MPKGIHTVDFPVATFHLKWTKSLKLNNPGAARCRVDTYMCLCYNAFIFFTRSVGLIVLAFGIMYIIG